MNMCRGPEECLLLNIVNICSIGSCRTKKINNRKAGKHSLKKSHHKEKFISKLHGRDQELFQECVLFTTMNILSVGSKSF